jgi:tRNA G18 (ribose-2'-O)-methylase SpoU
MRQVILYNVRSRHNVGAIFRTGEGAGVSKIWLVGYTPAPVDRFGREVAEIKKTSLGASDMVPWQQADDIFLLLEKLKEAGTTVVAIEQSPEAVSLFEYTKLGNVAYIFGNEITGVPPEILKQCDAVVDIPMAGRKESLNVATTVGIVLFQP